MIKHHKCIVLGVLVAVLSLAATGVDIPSFEKAKPVWPSGTETEMNSFFGFRSSFSAKGGERAILRITGCSDYRISINGRHAGWGPARAAKGYFRVDEILLEAKEGKNVVAVEVAGYNCLSYCHMKQPPFLQAEVVLNGSVVAHTGKDGTFEVQRLPRRQKVVRYSFQRNFSEAYRLEPGFDDWKQGKGKFSAVPIGECPSVKLLPRRAPYADFRVNGPLKPVSVAKTSFDATRKTLPIRFVDFDGKSATDNGFAKNELEVNWWEDLQRIVPSARVPASAAMKSRKTFRLAEGDSAIFDAGINDTGFLGLRVRCLKPGTVVVKFDEILVDGEVSPTRYGCANAVVWEFLEPGEYDVEAFEPYTLKYADVIAFKGDFEVSAPYVRTYKNPMAWRARFESSDRSLVQIFNAARETYAQNAADVFTDCPGRERAGWLCDSFFTGRSSLLFTGSLESEHLFLENYALAEGFENLPDGMFAMCYPADFRTGNFIPNWAMWLVLEVEEFRNRGGDAALVEALRPKLVRLVEYLRTFRNADGLLEKLPKWVFIEWSRANSLVQDVNYPSNMTWAEVLDAMDRLYAMPDLAKEATRVRAAIRRQSWTGKWFCDNAVRQKDGSLKLSGECTETCQYYAFYFRTATPKSHPELWNTLVEDFGPKRKETGKHPEIWPSNAFIGNYLRLECLAREGLSAQILDETRGFFLYMANLTGTLWENIGTTRSCNHGFASHVAVSYCRDILGLRKIDYRNRVVEFAPPEELPIESVSMEIPVEGGTIRAGWSSKKGKIAKEIKLPSGWKLSGKAGTLDPLAARWTFGAHEPYTMYRRVGRHCTGGIDGNAQWVQEWLDWFDAKAPAKMQEAGLNFIHSRFYKGMGWEVEKRDFSNVKRFVANCHAYGVKTLAYVQFNTFYPETMRHEIPDIDSWASVDADGRKNEYNCIWDDRQYFRWSPCLHCREWVAYLKSICTIALTEGGFDGIMFDNLIDYPCYCPRCQAAFREHLLRIPNPEARFGFRDISSMLMPRIPYARMFDMDIKDPVMQEWALFRCGTINAVARELVDHIKSVKPDALVSGNASPYRGRVRYLVAAHSMAELCLPFDFMLMQNANFPHVEKGGVVINRVRDLKFAQDIGQGVVALCDGDAKISPLRERNFLTAMVEDIVFGGVPSDRTIISPSPEPGFVNRERFEHRRRVHETFDAFVASHKESLSAPTIHSVRIFHPVRELVFSYRTNQGLAAAEEIFLRNRVPFGYLFAYPDRPITVPDGTDVIVVPGLVSLSGAQITFLASWARKGGKLVVTGDSGRYDEWNAQRRANPLLPQLTGLSNVAVRKDADLLPGGVSCDWITRAPPPADGGKALMDDLRKTGWVAPVEFIDLSPHVFAEYRRLPSGDVAIHLVNYDPEHEVSGAKVKLPRGTVATFDAPLDEKARTCDLPEDGVLPPFGRYALIVTKEKAQVANKGLTEHAVAPVPYGAFERELFLGDSITRHNMWTFDAEFIHAISHPGSKAHTVNRGIGGDTARGGFGRLGWDVLPAQPGRVFVMFGMNDVRRELWSDLKPSAEVAKKRDEAIKTYADYMSRIVDALTDKGIKVALITPSPYDVYGNYAVPAIGECNNALGMCAERVKELAAGKGLQMVDFHAPLTAFAKANPDFCLCGKDRVHPAPRGHLLMAVELMRQTGSLPAPVVHSFDAVGAVPFTFTVKSSRLPFPVTKDYAAINELYPLDGLLNAETLKVAGLPEGSYLLECEGRTLGVFESAELSKGINPAWLDTPASRRAHAAYEACSKLKQSVSELRSVAPAMQIIYAAGGDPSDRTASDKILDEDLDRKRLIYSKKQNVKKFCEWVVSSYRKNRDRIPELEAAVTVARSEMRSLCHPVEYSLTIRRKE